MPAAIGITAKLTSTAKRVTDAASKGAYKSLQHAGRSIRKAAVESMVFAKGPSPAGTPPHAHKGKLRRSILWQAEKEELVVGPAYSRVVAGGRPPWMASMLERGGVFKGKKKGSTRKFPPRPFMAPALEMARKRFKQDWQGSIG